jgi:uncharacterized protein YyaL (SSP411 family)
MKYLKICFARWALYTVLFAGLCGDAPYLSAQQKGNLMNSAKKSNRLAAEKSPYLLQHATNPVEWFPWGEAAFEKARNENKPIFLSIGYSTCHWCHVMAHESFEDAAIAEILNQHFVCIKVDREERPDVDRIYMTYVQATTGSGGWPLNVWLTPDREPFFGGTYFPPKDRFGRPAFPSLLERIARAWKEDRASILDNARQILAALRAEATVAAADQLPDAAPLETAYQKLLAQFDPEDGGFGKAPKFPRPANLHFLLRYAHRAGAKSEEGPVAAGMVFQTLRKMANGGMNDQLGGGFHRYSVDRFWHVPHYEKMLYDQAQISLCLIEAAQLSGDAFFEKQARRTLDYVQREMTDGGGGFHSAEDADSLFEHGKPEHGEGAYYLWTKSEIERVLGADAPLFCAVYGVEAEGNSPEGSDPHGELKGKNTLLRKLSDTQAGEKFGLPESEISRKLEDARQRLLEIRVKRPKPHRDDKILTAWNGLMISAFARGGAFMGESRYVEAARKAASFLEKNLWKKGVLLRSYREGASQTPGFAEDYAFLIQGLLDLYAADFDVHWLRWAVELQTTQDRLFWDAEAGGYFSSAADDAQALVRMKETHDGAEPAASSVAARNLQRLGDLTGNAQLREKAERTVRCFGQALKQSPGALPQMLCSLEALLSPAQQIVISGELSSADTQTLLRVVRERFLPHTAVLHAFPKAEKAGLGERFAGLAEMLPRQGKATAYVCENFVCEFPETSPEKLKARLQPR